MFPQSRVVANRFVDSMENSSNTALEFQGGLEESLVNSQNSGTMSPQVQGPKYRKPTSEEAEQHIADTKAMMALAQGTVAIATGGIPGAFAGIGAKMLGDHFEPKIGKHIRNSEWVPVYENWTENDFWNEFGGR